MKRSRSPKLYIIPLKTKRILIATSFTAIITGCIPAVGDTFTADGLSVEVPAVEKTRPDQIRVWKVVEETEE